VSTELPEGEAIRRLRTVDVDTLQRTAIVMSEAASRILVTAAKVRRLRADSAAHWQSTEHVRWAEQLASADRRLTGAGDALEEVASLLNWLSTETLAARTELQIFDRMVAEAYVNPALMGDLDGALRYAERAGDGYHRAEVRVRTRWWDLGDAAPLNAPPTPPPPPPPRRARWQSLRGGPAGYYTWGPGPGGTATGVDEDGKTVPAHRGRPAYVEVKEMGIGGLLRRLPGLSRRLRVPVRGSLTEMTEAFADDIARSYGWRAKHIDRHIREWYGLSKNAPVEPWMKGEFLKKVAFAVARSGKVIPGSLSGQPTHAMLHFDQSTMRYLVVHFHASGRYAGEFASAFRPTAQQVDELLRRAATVSGS
jgi:hypothetical protein